jgi:hypothetical protein
VTAPVPPWGEVKSRRGAPKRVNTEGYACSNHQCPTSASPMLESTPWWEMVSMVMLNGSTRFAARRATLRSALDATLRCTV